MKPNVKKFVIDEVMGSIPGFEGLSVVSVRVLKGEVRIGDRFVLDNNSVNHPLVHVVRIVYANKDVDFLSEGTASFLVFREIPFPYVMRQILVCV
jgi:hypothetical protein